MHFKITILFLFFIIATNSFVEAKVSPIKVPTKEEAIEEAYKVALKHFKVPLGGGLSASDMEKYVHNNHYEIVKKYYTDNEVSLQDQNNINLELFNELVEAICRYHWYDPVQFAKSIIEEKNY